MKTNKIVILLVFAILLTLIFLQANMSRPGKALKGNDINAPSRWKETDQHRFVVATYNIRRGRGNDGIGDISRSAEVLKNARADIVGLNELSGTLFYGIDDQAEQIARILDTGWLFAPTEDRLFQHYFGNGLLSRFPVSHWEIHPLYEGIKESCNSRNMIIARIPISGKDVHFLITHLDRCEINELQLSHVLKTFKTLPSPAVVLGDFNVDADHPHLSSFLNQSEFSDSISTALKKDISRVDWIISKGLVVADGGMEPKGVSDHPGFWVEFEFEDEY